MTETQFIISCVLQGVQAVILFLLLLNVENMIKHHSL
jgi:hypothetical protein